MTNQKNILIVDSNKNDQHLVALLFKRGLHGDACLSITYASCLTEAQNHLSDQQFTAITLDGEFPSFVDPRLGHTLIPLIKETQKESPVIIMVSGERLDVKQGMKHGATHGFTKQQIQGEVKFNDCFELVPIHQTVCE